MKREKSLLAIRAMIKTRAKENVSLQAPQELKNQKTNLDPLYGKSSPVSWLWTQYQQILYFKPLTSQVFLTFIWSTSEG